MFIVFLSHCSGGINSSPFWFCMVFRSLSPSLSLHPSSLYLHLPLSLLLSHSPSISPSLPIYLSSSLSLPISLYPSSLSFSFAPPSLSPHFPLSPSLSVSLLIRLPSSSYRHLSPPVLGAVWFQKGSQSLRACVGPFQLHGGRTNNKSKQNKSIPSIH